jgi:hypothetical protein
MTEFLTPGERVILPGYKKTLKTGYGEETVDTPTREGVFKKYVESGIRRGTNGLVVSDVKEIKPVVSIADQEMFDPRDVGIPVTSERLRRLSNLLDCCIERLESFLDGDEDAKGEARALLENMAKIPGVGPYGFQERYKDIGEKKA